MSSTAMEYPSPELSVTGTPSFCRSVMSENEAVMTEMKQPQEEEGINSNWSEVQDQQQQHGEEEVTCTPYTNIRNESVIDCNGSEISSDSNNNSPAASVEVISTEVGHHFAAEEVFQSDAFATRSPLPSSRKIRAVEVNLFESSPAGGSGQCVLESVVPLYPTSPQEKVLIEQRKLSSSSCSTLESFDTHSSTSKLSYLKHFAIIVIAAIIFMIPHLMEISGPQSSSLQPQLAIDYPFTKIPLYLTSETTKDISAPLEAAFIGSMIVSQPSEPLQQTPPTTQQPSSNPLKLHVLISVNKTSNIRQEPAKKGLKRQLSLALGSVHSSTRSFATKIVGALTHWAHSVEQVLLPDLDGNELEYML